jgi:hypothetical protein
VNQLRYCSSNFLEGVKKIRKIRVALLTEIRTEHLPDTSVERCTYLDQPVRCVICALWVSLFRSFSLSQIRKPSNRFPFFLLRFARLTKLWKQTGVYFEKTFLLHPLSVVLNPRRGALVGEKSCVLYETGPLPYRGFTAGTSLCSLS